METPGTDEPSPTAVPGPPTAVPGPPSTGPATTPPPSTGPAVTPPPVPPPNPPSAPGGSASDPDPGGPHGAFEGVDQIFEGGLDGEWPARAADAIVNVVGAVRDNTTGRLITIARGLVFGLFAVVLGTAIAVMLIIAAIRLLDEALPSGVWLAYLVLGVVVVIGGALVFRKRNQPAPTGNTGRP